MKNFESIFAAYMIGWAVFFVYQVSVARRIRAAEEEIERLRSARR